MAKSKCKFSLAPCITLITGLLGFVMFFLPNLQVVQKTLDLVYNSSGMNMLSGIFDIKNADTATYNIFDGTDGNFLAYLIAILLTLSAIALLVSAVISCLQLFGVKCDYSLVGKIAVVASILMIVALIVALIRCGQIDGLLTAGLAYGLIVGLLFAIATAVVPLVIKK